MAHNYRNPPHGGPSNWRDREQHRSAPYQTSDDNRDRYATGGERRYEADRDEGNRGRGFQGDRSYDAGGYAEEFGYRRDYGRDPGWREERGGERQARGESYGRYSRDESTGRGDEPERWDADRWTGAGTRGLGAEQEWRGGSGAQSQREWNRPGSERTFEQSRERPRGMGGFGRARRLEWRDDESAGDPYYYGTGSHYGGGFATAPSTRASGAGSYGAPGYASKGAWSDNQDWLPESNETSGSQESYGRSRYGAQSGYGRNYGSERGDDRGYGQNQWQQGSSNDDERWQQRWGSGYSQDAWRSSDRDEARGSSGGGRGGYMHSYGRDSAGGDRQRYPQQRYPQQQTSRGAQSQQSYRGHGPKGYQRSDERLKEMICEQLTEDPSIDASEISIEVSGQVVKLSGAVEDRATKYHIEEMIEQFSGVKDIDNQLRVRAGRNWGSQNSGASTGQGAASASNQASSGGGNASSNTSATSGTTATQSGPSTTQQGRSGESFDAGSAASRGTTMSGGSSRKN